jgi:ABC-2 type transport system permease protein
LSIGPITRRPGAVSATDGAVPMTSASVRTRPGGFSTSAGAIPTWERFMNVWNYRRILALLVHRDLKVRYAASFLGYVWSVLDPLLMSLVFWFIFTQIFHRHVGYPPYILFLVMGQMIMTWFQSGVTATAKSLRAEAQMVRSSSVPRELWIVRVAMSKGVEYVYSLPVVLMFALAYRKPPNWHIIFLPVAMLLCFFMVLSIGLILAPLTVLIRDIDRIIPIILRFLFYCSPVLWSIKDVPASLRGFAYYNPLAGFLTLSRSAFFPQELVWKPVVISFISIFILFNIGIWVFTRFESQMLKEI